MLFPLWVNDISLKKKFIFQQFREINATNVLMWWCNTLTHSSAHHFSRFFRCSCAMHILTPKMCRSLYASLSLSPLLLSFYKQAKWIPTKNFFVYAVMQQPQILHPIDNDVTDENVSYSLFVRCEYVCFVVVDCCVSVYIFQISYLIWAIKQIRTANSFTSDVRM